MLIELHFPVVGNDIPADHGYALYGAMSRLVPKLHSEELRLRIGPIRGTYLGEGKLRLEQAKLRVRLRPDDLPMLLPLAGKRLDLDGHAVRLGVPQVWALVPAPNLIARIVVIKASSPKTDSGDRKSRVQTLTKRYLDPAEFLAGARKQLKDLNIEGEPAIPLTITGPHAGQPRRHVLRIHDKHVVGFTLQVTGLTAAESIRLQEGIGGRGKMGGGFFVPMREENR